jgi:DNA-directed RNA polymerase subunit omega
VKDSERSRITGTWQSFGFGLVIRQDPGDSNQFPQRDTIISMKTHLIDEAAKVIGNKQQLINMVSKRLRELSAGSRPMIEVDLQMGLADIALAEIAAGKLTAEFLTESGDSFAAA